MSQLSTNYSGRTVDLSIFPDLSAIGIPAESKLSIQPKAVAGIAMAVQNFARILLTPLGNYRADPLMGSNFSQKLSNRYILYPSDLQQVFLIESARVLDYMASHYGSAPLDERIQSVSLLSSSVRSTTISMTIAVVTAAGNTVSFILPVVWNY